MAEYDGFEFHITAATEQLDVRAADSCNFDVKQGGVVGDGFWHGEFLDAHIACSVQHAGSYNGHGPSVVAPSTQGQLAGITSWNVPSGHHGVSPRLDWDVSRSQETAPHHSALEPGALVATGGVT
jgi:hypothetical protein